MNPLCAIVDVDAAAGAGWRPVDLARAFIAGGARFLQLRAKAMPGGAVINDRADIARLASADGVHVGQDDLAPAAVRLLVGEHAIVGLSTHTLEQVDEAVRLSVGPSRAITYVAIGPVFGTTTKATGYEAIGLAMVREASRRAGARGLPLVAIGGITLERAASVIEAGAASVAVISDLLATGDPEGRVREFIARLSMANG
ncbi:MAG: thiamine phosphate synthase [Acidobacteria bacterium]|nr:MAG: thiamine phosphate synthase [Acidobacteriota bacterium]